MWLQGLELFLGVHFSLGIAVRSFCMTRERKKFCSMNVNSGIFPQDLSVCAAGESAVRSFCMTRKGTEECTVDIKLFPKHTQERYSLKVIARFVRFRSHVLVTHTHRGGKPPEMQSVTVISLSVRFDPYDSIRLFSFLRFHLNDCMGARRTETYREMSAVNRVFQLSNF